MPHGDAIIHTNGIKFKGNAIAFTDGVFDDPAIFLKMNMSGDQVDIGIYNTDKGLFKIVVAFNNTGCFKQTAMGRPVDAGFNQV